ncbi:hypothetical protein OB955_20360 [Halobacteria archaeon AArc-m2/3/4]|uniref:LexA-binding, inner membrane-associated hydrolase n=1 Tax=Natronoglomus mannanivorans TaxID=2979990 RepID=A0ABT2QJF4_9EURY|nr:hypothetical protein [Halobacteria archaeon AArc-m2/3/4]
MKTYLIRAIGVSLIGIFSVLVGFHPVVLFCLLIGVFIPDVDAIDERVHRSWIFHTFLPPTVAYVTLTIAGYGSAITFVHFVTIGMLVHFVLDFVYPKHQIHDGAAWPVRPTIGSAPWGLLLLGISWTIQWFLYLSNSFLPWLVGM